MQRPAGEGTARPPQAWRYAVVISPLALFLFLAFAAPAFLAPLWDTSVTVIGLPLGFLLVAATAALVALGVFIVHVRRDAFGLLLAIVVSVFPALFLVILAPAIVLIAANLAMP